MPANNFLADNPKAKSTGVSQDDQPVVKWTEPVLENQNVNPKSADSFFDMLKNTGAKKSLKQETETEVGDFEKNKQTLHEYDSAVQAEKNIKNLQMDNAGKKIKNIDRPWTLKTNLIKEDVTTFVNWRRNIIFSLFGLVIVILIIGGAYSYLVYKEYKAASEEKDLSAEIAKLDEQIGMAKKAIVEADSFQKKMSQTAKLLDEHIYWTEFFRFIEENTLANTFYVGSFSGDTKSSFKFSVSTDSYQDIDNQLRVFRANKLVQSVKTDSASFKDEKSGANGKISYDLELSVSPEVFKKK